MTICRDESGAYRHHRCSICKTATARGSVGYGDGLEAANVTMPAGWVLHYYLGPPRKGYIPVVINGVACPDCKSKAVDWPAVKKAQKASVGPGALRREVAALPKTVIPHHANLGLASEFGSATISPMTPVEPGSVISVPRLPICIRERVAFARHLSECIWWGAARRKEGRPNGTDTVMETWVKEALSEHFAEELKEYGTIINVGMNWDIGEGAEFIIILRKSKEVWSVKGYAWGGFGRDEDSTVTLDMRTVHRDL